MNIANEIGQDFAVVTYDLNIAVKAYSIQAIESPMFDKLLIMLGNFHIELAFFGAVGTYINGSGIEYILTEADILAEGSIMGFLKGKFYNRCKRIHPLLANVMEKKLYERYLNEIAEEELISFQDAMMRVPSDVNLVEEHLEDPVITEHLRKYEEFFLSVVDGKLGQTAKFWAIYIFLINRLYRELQRCVRMNDVHGYMNVFPKMLVVFCADYCAGCGTKKLFLGYDPPQIVVQPMIFLQPISGPVKMAKHPIAHKWLLCTLLFTNYFCDGIKYEKSP